MDYALRKVWVMHLAKYVFRKTPIQVIYKEVWIMHLGIMGYALRKKYGFRNIKLQPFGAILEPQLSQNTGIYNHNLATFS